jgi:hypothetical protein
MSKYNDHLSFCWPYPPPVNSGKRTKGPPLVADFQSPQICHLLVGAPKLVVAPGHRCYHTGTATSELRDEESRVRCHMPVFAWPPQILIRSIITDRLNGGALNLGCARASASGPKGGATAAFTLFAAAQKSPRCSNSFLWRYILARWRQMRARVCAANEGQTVFVSHAKLKGLAGPDHSRQFWAGSFSVFGPKSFNSFSTKFSISLFTGRVG